MQGQQNTIEEQKSVQITTPLGISFSVARMQKVIRETLDKS